jgi:hypothetical protein
MNRLQKVSLTILAATLVGTVPAMAQQKRVSPHETVSTQIGEGRVMLVYGRPYAKNPKGDDVRKIWGSLVPFGQVWRTGADEATLFVTEQPLEIGGTVVPAGAYSLYTLPQEDGSAKLIINKQVGQWGTDYDESKDLARVDLKKTATEKPEDEFTMGFDRNGAGKTATGGTLKMMWENVEYSVPFSVKK